jgi:hypothetical protein
MSPTKTSVDNGLTSQQNNFKNRYQHLKADNGFFYGGILNEK